MEEPLLLMLCSPSGAGKSTLTRHLLATFDDVMFSVSHTTRAPRQGEQDGTHYHFVERAVFESMREEGRFAEHAVVHQNLYGTSLDELERARREGKTGIIFDIDVQGARQIKARLPSAIGVFILPPSMAELERRLRGRGTDADAVIARRLDKARDEIEHYAFFDYLVMNDDLERAKDTVAAIVTAERTRRTRLAEAAETLLR